MDSQAAERTEAESFRQFLAKGDLGDSRRIFPAWNGKPIPLDITQIRKEFDGEGLEYERLDTDFDVWRELAQKSVQPKSLRYLLKDCAKLAQLPVEDTRLNSTLKESILAVFFTVFDITPKLSGIAPTAAETDKAAEPAVTDKDILEKHSDKIFPEGVPSEPCHISYATVKDSLSIASEDVIDSPASLRTYMEQLKKGVLILDLTIQLCKEQGIVIEEKRLRGLARNVYIPIFFALFAVDFPAPAASKSPETPQEITEEVEPAESSAPVSLEDMQRLFGEGNKITADSWDINNSINFYRGMPVKATDGFWIKPDREVYYGLAGLIQENDKTVVAVGRLENWQEGETLYPHLVFPTDKIRYAAFDESRSFLVLLFPADKADYLATGRFNREAYDGDIYTVPVNLECKTPEETDKTLCIDFGTSNTTAGTYGFGKDSADISLVEFASITSEGKPQLKPMLPTVVLVDSVQGEEPTFKFGYDAQRDIVAADYTTEATVFNEIKRFLNDLDGEVGLYDKAGRKFAREVKKRDILAAYLRYVIATAEEQFKVHFKKLHFTAPVKLKGDMMRAVHAIFKQPEEGGAAKRSYAIEEKSIDEALAIVYHFIAHRPESKNSGDIMILDCGGGTTDLASCHYELTEGKLGKVLTVNTGFENGEANFGGNNITYRILQMLKIKIAAHLKEGVNQKMETLVNYDEAKILSLIDSPVNDDKGSAMTRKQQVDAIYAEFEKAYREAEKLIPTRWHDYTGRKTRPFVQRNFYFLWQMAEAVKIEFYKTNRVQVDFGNEGERKIATPNFAQYYLYIKNEATGKLEKIASRPKNPMERVEMTVNEINRIICPDIYNLLNTVLDRFVGSDLGEGMKELQKYWYRLSGQSCKIPLFHDLLKEFIPGKLIRNERKDGEQSVDSSVLKKLCIYGSIEYIRDKARGEIKPVINPLPAQRIYSVHLMKSDNTTEQMLGSDGSIHLLYRPAEIQEAEFVVLDKQGIEKNRVSCKIKPKKKSDSFTALQNYILEVTYNDAAAANDKLKEAVFDKIRDVDPQKDNNGDPVLCLFVLPAAEGYGFNVFHVLVKVVKDTDKGRKYQAAGHYYNYENESLSVFFDGEK